jgi:hypothetical protein
MDGRQPLVQSRNVASKSERQSPRSVRAHIKRRPGEPTMSGHLTRRMWRRGLLSRKSTSGCFARFSSQRCVHVRPSIRTMASSPAGDRAQRPRRPAPTRRPAGYWHSPVSRPSGPQSQPMRAFARATSSNQTVPFCSSQPMRKASSGGMKSARALVLPWAPGPAV